MIEISIALIIVLGIIIYLYNALIIAKNEVNNSRASIDVFLKKRFDLIPNLIETVKGYKEYEKEVLTKLTELRTSYTSGEDTNIDLNLDNKFQKMVLLAERYPDLKASESFVKLQEQLESLEDQLQAARRYYNSAVTKYNTRIKVIPYNMIATIFNMKEEKLFEATDEEKEEIKVKI